MPRIPAATDDIPADVRAVCDRLKERYGSLPLNHAALARSARERAALAYAESIATASSVPDDLFKNVKQHFNEDEIVELTATITREICAKNSIAR